jgi:hypothetical protein
LPGRITMRIVKVAVALLSVYAVYQVSDKLLIIVSLFIVGSVIATGVEKGKDFKGEIAFHKCCSAIQWALMSFYLFILETLASYKADARAYRAAGALLLITLRMYVFATSNVQRVLANNDPHLFSTPAEKRNVAFGAWSMILLLTFVLWMRFYYDVRF